MSATAHTQRRSGAHQRRAVVGQFHGSRPLDVATQPGSNLAAFAPKQASADPTEVGGGSTHPPLAPWRTIEFAAGRPATAQARGMDVEHRNDRPYPSGDVA